MLDRILEIGVGIIFFCRCADNSSRGRSLDHCQGSNDHAISVADLNALLISYEKSMCKSNTYSPGECHVEHTSDHDDKQSPRGEFNFRTTFEGRMLADMVNAASHQVVDHSRHAGQWSLVSRSVVFRYEYRKKQKKGIKLIMNDENRMVERGGERERKRERERSIRRRWRVTSDGKAEYEMLVLLPKKAQNPMPERPSAPGSLGTKGSRVTRAS